jgi:hypothetical protein
VVSPLMTVDEIEAIWAAVRLDMATVLPLDALIERERAQTIKKN